jgi:hypothetical protein
MQYITYINNSNSNNSEIKLMIRRAFLNALKKPNILVKKSGIKNTTFVIAKNTSHVNTYT